MDLIIGDLALHIDKTAMLMLAILPIMIVIQIPAINRSIRRLIIAVKRRQRNTDPMRGLK